MLKFGKTLTLGLALAIASNCWAADSKDEVLELYWEDMVPEDAGPPPGTSYDLEALQHLGEIMAQQDESDYGTKVVHELAGQRVKLPAYVVPLESDAETVTEFLLVPYFGACIHVPPPPPNQIVYGTSKKGLPNEMFDAIWATGVIQIEHTTSELAEASYSMIVEKTEPLDLDE